MSYQTAAMEVVARRGFDATVDEIAQTSGVSPRTIFRHYASHDRLIPATVKDMCVGWFEGLPQPPTTSTAGSRTWRSRSTPETPRLGAAFWDIHAPEPTHLWCSPR